MEGLICEACGDTQVRDLPVVDRLELYPCPVCQPQYWPRGFPGEYCTVNGEIRWIIKPSNPGQPAEYCARR